MLPKKLKISIIREHADCTYRYISTESFHYKLGQTMFQLSFFSGTGSYPPRENGLHRKIRHRASILPLKAPNLSIASIPYSEQVGIYLQQPYFFLGDKFTL